MKNSAREQAIKDMKAWLKSQDKAFIAFSKIKINEKEISKAIKEQLKAQKKLK